MSKAKRKVLYLLVEGLPAEQKPETGADAEVFTLLESNAAEALQKIFAADAVSVWGKIKS